jgi:hypothetical protein
MGHSEYDPAAKERRPWNAGRMVGAKRALKPQQVCHAATSLLRRMRCVPIYGPAGNKSHSSTPRRYHHRVGSAITATKQNSQSP